MRELGAGDYARLRSRLSFYDRKNHRAGQHHNIGKGTIVRIFQTDAGPRDHSYPSLLYRFHIETCDGAYETVARKRDLVELSPLEQLAVQADD